MTQVSGPERGWTYGRVSDDKLGYSKSVPDQEAVNEDVFTEDGSVIERRYSDEDRSASRFAKKERTDWKRLLADLEVLRPPDFIGFWKIDRGDRTMDTWVPFLTLCRRLGIKIRVAEGRRAFDPAAAMDRKWLLNAGADAEGTSEQISQDVRRGLAGSAARGKPHGPVLYGLTRHYNSRGKLTEVTVNEEEAAVVREVFGRFSRNESPLRIRDDLTRRGIPTPRAAAAARELPDCEDPVRRAVLEGRLGAAWAVTTLTSMIRCRSYTGDRIAHGERVATAIWPAIVTEAVAQQARAVLRDRSETSRRPGRVKYLLSFIAECAVCGHILQGKPTYGKTEAGRGGDYWCPTAGGHPRRRIPMLDAYVTEAVIARLCLPDIMRHLGAGDDMRRDIDRLTASVAERERRLDDAYQSNALTGEPPLRSVTAMAAALRPVIAEERERLRRLTVSPLLDGLAGVSEEAVREAWEGLELAQKRAVIRLLVVRISLSPAGKGSRRPLRETVRITWRRAGGGEAG